MILLKASNSKSLRFMILFISLYLITYNLTIFWIGITTKGILYWQFADEHLNFIRAFRYFLLNSAAIICSLFDYPAVVIGEYKMRITGGSGIRLVYSCLGYGVMSFYAAFVLAWPTADFKAKCAPLIAGLSTIVLLNILRLGFLPILFTTYPNIRNFPIDHHDIFNFIVYLVVAGMLYSWTRSLASKPS